MHPHLTGTAPAARRNYHAEVRALDLIGRLELAAERLLTLHLIGHFGAVTDTLKLINGVHARWITAEMLRRTLAAEPDEFSKIRENLTHDVLAGPYLQAAPNRAGARGQRVFELAIQALQDRA